MRDGCSVPETLLKKREAARAANAKGKVIKLAAKKRNAVKRTAVYARAQKYAREYKKVRRRRVVMGAGIRAERC
jgi:hypothetical protein